MAEYCKTCDPESKDFELTLIERGIHLVTGRRNAWLCEGCGGYDFDQHGYCIDPDCKKHGKPKKGDKVVC